MSHLSRRRVLLSGPGLILAGCGEPQSSAVRSPPQPKPAVDPLAEAVAGVWRTPAERARDRWRRPAETLRFFGLQPGATVVEFWPGVGWWTQILAPYLARTGGRYVAAQPDADPALVETFRRRFANTALYGRVEIARFGPASGPVVPAGSADLVLFMRNLHNWMAAGLTEKAFRDAHAALKPGGTLGIEQHRADPEGVQDPVAASGYVQQAYVVGLAEEAGFRLEAASELNANPKDDRDHPFGVWTLPPVRLSAPRGSPPDPSFDRTTFDAVGESDRMTLRFRRP